MPHEQILSLIDGGQRCVGLHGCTGSYLALTLARLAHLRCSGESPLVVVTADEDRARELTRDLAFFLGAGEDHPAMALGQVMMLPHVETSPYAEISFDRAGMMQRMGVLFRISQGYAGKVLVASAESARSRVIPPLALAELCDLIGEEEELDRDALVARLLSCGYNRAQVVEDPGTFSVRGGIVDLFPPLNRYPARLEFFGDWVESIRLFDPASQRTLRTIEEVFIYPVRETIPSGGADLRQTILDMADSVNHPTRKTRALLDELGSGREFFGVEALTPAFHPHMDSLSSYLPQGGIWVVLDPGEVRETLAREDDRAGEAHAASLGQGRICFAPSSFYVDAGTLMDEVRAHPLVEVSPLTPDAADPANTVTTSVRDTAGVAAELTRARSAKGEAILGALATRLRDWQQEGQAVLLAAGSRGHAERLDSLLRGYGITTDLQPTPGLPCMLDGEPSEDATVRIHAGELSRGFHLPGGLTVLAEGEIFGPRVRRRRPRAFAGPGLGDLRDLREGDCVVHADHGVARYHGLVKLAIRGVPADFLNLEFAGKDRLYLPVYRMNQVQKYLGAEGKEPKLDRLGGATWAKKKRKVKVQVRKLAEELLQLYAQRAALSGHTYPTGDAMFEEFQATFPFTETPDQEQAIADVLEDMASSRPMDRLVCGDVGFGKTEVALRAAFLAAMDGRQVAVLAPTTVLVEQHARSFADRMGPFPLRVEAVSRFRKTADLRKVLADLTAGRVDVVIGTHRLLSADVRFKDLGLLIIDEEQRFGVAHKERLKRMRTQVDVLTLTATPIPRTLQMGMVGMREISVITTPPVDRLSIRTFVARYDDDLVTRGITKELDRGGQVFFVHNRVETIAQWAERVSDLVPEARVAVGHGQMDARRLERVMLDFVSGRTDVLVCTAIIESGLDIPRANTMFINRADCFGLGQLYQLRGRIGRSRHRAFCHLLVPGFERMTGDARQRLNTLQRFTELGSGFSVATHDLEIRGAGDLLGARQSGQIAAVGFETYARILEDAVAELKGEPIIRETDPELNTCIAAFIPDEYVEDTGQRLDLYRRLSHAAHDEDGVGDILAEILDRYGPRPDEVDALGELMVVKGLAASLGATVVDLTESRLSLTLNEATPLSTDQIVRLVSGKKARFKLTPEDRLIRRLDEQEKQAPLSATKKILHDLLVLGNNNG